MRRWLVLLLLAILPLQLSWAAMAGYCQHEKAPAQRSHFGHHAHEHGQAGEPVAGLHAVAVDDATDPGPEQDPPGQGSVSALDEDCAYCHLGCAQPLITEPIGPWPGTPSPQVAAVNALPESHIASVPERPDWRLA